MIVHYTLKRLHDIFQLSASLKGRIKWDRSHAKVCGDNANAGCACRSCGWSCSAMENSATLTLEEQNDLNFCLFPEQNHLNFCLSDSPLDLEDGLQSVLDGNNSSATFLKEFEMALSKFNANTEHSVKVGKHTEGLKRLQDKLPLHLKGSYVAEKIIRESMFGTTLKVYAYDSNEHAVKVKSAPTSSLPAFPVSISCLSSLNLTLSLPVLSLSLLFFFLPSTIFQQYIT